jgi:transcriptional regulator with XRE-family HTH domain
VTPNHPPDAPAEQPDIFPAAFGRAIKVIRTGLGMDRKRLASAAHLSYSYVAEIENGRKPASASAQHALARALGLSPSMLLAAAEEWAARMREGAAPLALEEPHAGSSRRTSDDAATLDLPRDERGARARQQRWFHASTLPRGAGARAPQDAEGPLEQDLGELQTLLASMSPEDRERVLDLARRLARE